MGASLSERVVLFDLDGTVADTAADLYAALERLCIEQTLAPPPYAQFRRIVSLGATAMLGLSFDVATETQEFHDLRARLLQHYRQELCVKTTLFAGMQSVLEQLDASGVRWGIVTNKPDWLTQPLLRQLNISPSPACIVSGDTLEKRKPDPDQLLHASQLCRTASSSCVYVGDARSDMIAAKRARMPCIAAAYGYIPVTEDIGSWEADEIVDAAAEVYAAVQRIFQRS